MNDNVTKKLRDACASVKEKGLKIKQGIWFEWENGQIIACDALGAYLLENNLIPESINPEDVSTLTHPGFVKAICTNLKVDSLFLRQFWMGFDRGHQVLMIDDKNKEHKDEVSAFGIQLWKEVK